MEASSSATSTLPIQSLTASPTVSTRWFSCPHEGIAREFLVDLCGEYAKAYADRFLRQIVAPLRLRSSGIPEQIEAWMSQAHELSTDWHPIHGLIRGFVRHGSDDPLPLAAQFSLFLAAAGVEGRTAIRLHSPRMLRVGRWPLPEAVEFQVDSSPARLSVRTRSGGTWNEHVWTRTPRQPSTLRTGTLEEAPRILQQEFDFLILHGIAGREFGVDVEADSGLQVTLPEIREQCRQAIDLMAEVSPVFVPWVSSVLREIVPLSGTPDLMRSGSDEVYDGRIHISFPAHLHAVTEMLIHETTHLYFSIAKRFDDLDSGQDKTLYPSPVKGTDRPIEKILLAYHAFANVLLFYKDCVDAGRDEIGYCAKNIERHRPELLKLREALVATTGLTQAGRDIWEPLDERLAWVRP